MAEGRELRHASSLLLHLYGVRHSKLLRLALLPSARSVPGSILGPTPWGDSSLSNSDESNGEVEVLPALSWDPTD
jgi:hypothetical protein